VVEAAATASNSDGETRAIAARRTPIAGAHGLGTVAGTNGH
jgi:hypothetical protein